MGRVLDLLSEVLALLGTLVLGLILVIGIGAVGLSGHYMCLPHLLPRLLWHHLCHIGHTQAPARGLDRRPLRRGQVSLSQANRLAARV